MNDTVLASTRLSLTRSDEDLFYGMLLYGAENRISILYKIHVEMRIDNE